MLSFWSSGEPRAIPGVGRHNFPLPTCTSTSLPNSKVAALGGLPGSALSWKELRSQASQAGDVVKHFLSIKPWGESPVPHKFRHSGVGLNHSIWKNQFRPFLNYTAILRPAWVTWDSILSKKKKCCILSCAQIVWPEYRRGQREKNHRSHHGEEF